MPTEPRFSIGEAASKIVFTFDGQELAAPDGISVAAALLVSGVTDFRASVVGRCARAPYCMMGVCFECLVEIDGVPARQSCLIPLRAGMEIRRQVGAAELDFAAGDQE